jgi:hypothetical protein
MRGQAGDFDDVTWPGLVAYLTASAPGRFAGTINQAPMWRRTRHPLGRPYDMTLNAIRTWRVRSIPPDHLQEQVFETCRSYHEVRRRLEKTPIARPTIYTLVGCRSAKVCVTERTIDRFQSRETETGTANGWRHSVPHWEARISTPDIFMRSFAEAADNTRTHPLTWRP